jgi:hypothetical protein
MTGDEMSEDARFGAAAGDAPRARTDDYGFFAPVRTASPALDGRPGDAGVDRSAAAAPFTPGQLSAPAPFGSPAPAVPSAAPPPSGLPVWAVAVFGAGALVVLAIVAAIVIPALRNNGQAERLVGTSLALPTTVVGLPRTADPATQSQADQLAAFIPSTFRSRRSGGYVSGSSTLLVAAAKPRHVLTFAEQEALSQAFWAQQARSVPDDASLGAPSTPSGAGASGTLTCADELTSDGSATVCVDAQATALVVFVLSSTSGAGSDPTAPAQVPPAVVHAG